MAAKSWDRSKVTEGVLGPFVVTGSISVWNYRIPKATEAGVYVIFVSHLEHGFGIPSSLFFWCFCAFY
jgi:hypothetical protein